MKNIITLFLFTTLICSCSIKKMAVRSTVDILNDGMKAFYEEHDLAFAREAAAGNIKMLEGMLLSDPGNRKLLAILSRSFANYSLAFVETGAWLLQQSDPLGYRNELRRAQKFYSRGREYGLRALPDTGNFNDAFEKDLDDFKKHLKGYSKKDVSVLFWLAFNWALEINLSLNKPSSIAELPYVVALMSRIMELDETYYYGGPHLFFGTYYAGRPKMLGGNPEKGKEHFEKAVSISKGKFLIAYLFYAKFYAIQTQNKKKFQELLNNILNAPADILPQENLANALAIDVAKKLSRKIDDFFVGGS